MNPRHSHKLTVLLADDSVAVLNRLAALLEADERIEVIGEAEFVIDALLLFQQRQPDVVVLDLQFMDGNGLEALSRIKASTPQCRVILLSNYCTPECRQEFLRLGADHVFHKATQFEEAIQLLGEFAAKKPTGPLPCT